MSSFRQPLEQFLRRTLLPLSLPFGCAPQASPSFHSVIDGHWQVPCTKKDSLFEAFAIDLELQNAKNLVRREVYYADQGCTQPLASLAYEGTYSLLMVQTKDYFYGVDLQIERQTITPLSDQGVERLHEVNFCGQTAWTLGGDFEPLSFEPANCTAVGPVPLKNLNLVEIRRGRTLRFGGEIAIENERPTEVDAQSLIYRYQAPDH